MPGDSVEPHVRISKLLDELFDAASYANIYTDVAAELSSKNFDPRGHFQDFGMAEGRAPSLFFDIAYVCARLAEAGRGVAPTEAFVTFASLPPAQRFVPNQWFCPWFFRREYEACFEAEDVLSDYELFVFYLSYVKKNAVSPSALFSEEAYRLNYGKEWAASGLRAGILHFLLRGCSEGLCNLPGYGVAAAPGLVSEATFLRNGGTGAAPFWCYDEEFYLTAYPDVHAMTRAGQISSGLTHFLSLGCQQGRVPHPAVGGTAQPARQEEGMDFLRRVATRAPAGGTGISFTQACSVRALMAPADDEAYWRLTEAIWPFVAPAVGQAPIATSLYAAANPDIAELTRGNEVALQRHWREYGFAEGRQAVGTNIFGTRRIGLEALLGWRNGVNFIAPLSSVSGLGNAARGYLDALRTAGVPVAEYDVSGLLNPAYRLDLIDAAALPYSINFIFLNADQVLSFARRYGTEIFDGRANVGAWVWELPAPRVEWRAVLAAFDLLIVPSRFTRDSFALFTDVPIEVVPYALDEQQLRAIGKAPSDEPALARLQAAKAAGTRIALFVMDASSYTARKGLDLFERLAARHAASGEAGWLFVLKTHARDYSLGEAQSWRRAKGLTIIDGALSATELYRLKSLADIYISPHRSEGFGLNIAESLLLGVPALISDYGGMAEWLPSSYKLKLPGKLVEIGRDMGPYRRDAIWYEPDFEALCQLFDAARVRLPVLPRGLRQKLAAAFAPARVGAQLCAALSAHCGYEAPGAAPGLERFRPLSCRPHDDFFTIALPPGATGAPDLRALKPVLDATARPFFSIITPTYNADPAWLEELYEDLIAQGFPAWEWCLSDDGSTRPETLACLRSLRKRDARILVRFGAENIGISENTNQAVQFASGSYLVMVDHDDRISPKLLETYRTWIGESTKPLLLYCDEDKINLDGTRGEHYFKPDFSHEYLLSCMYMLHCLCVEKAAFLRLGGYRARLSGAQDHDFALRAISDGVLARHVDALLYSWRKAPTSTATSGGAKGYAMERGREAVQEHLARLRVEGMVVHGKVPGTYRVRPHLPQDVISVNILLNAGTAADPVAPLRGLLGVLQDASPAQPYQLRIITDMALDRKALRLHSLPVQAEIITPRAAGNGGGFAVNANFAVSTAAAERIVLLDGALARLEPGWLEALMEVLEIPGVGVAGGRLLKPCGSFAHAGIALGVCGLYANLFVNMAAEESGYNSYAKVIRNVSAVSGTMTAFRKSLFTLTGGFDTTFPGELAHIDFCLRAAEAGQRTVYTPYASAMFAQHASGRNADNVDAKRFLRKWAPQVARDPYYNINFRRDTPQCEQA